MNQHIGPKEMQLRALREVRATERDTTKIAAPTQKRKPSKRTKKAKSKRKGH